MNENILLALAIYDINKGYPSTYNHFCANTHCSYCIFRSNQPFAILTRLKCDYCLGSKNVFGKFLFEREMKKLSKKYEVELFEWKLKNLLE